MGRDRCYRGGNPGGYPAASIVTDILARYIKRMRLPKHHQWSGPEVQAFNLWRTEWLNECLSYLPPWGRFS